MSRPVSIDDLYRVAVPVDPQIGPGGRLVAYVLVTADRDLDADRTEIWLAGDGTARRLTDGPADSAPRWSPDGRELTFLRAVDGVLQLHLVSVDGDVRMLCDRGGAGTPVWSPDGMHIAFVGTGPEPIGTTRHLFTAHVASGRVRQLTRGDFDIGTPKWSPDGRHLAYVTSTDPDRAVTFDIAAYTVDADGGEPQRVTTGAYFCHAVWWLGGDLFVAAQFGKPTGHVRLYRHTDGGLTQVASGVDRGLSLGAAGFAGADPMWHDGKVVFCARDHGLAHLYDSAGVKIVSGDRSVHGATAAAGRIAFVGVTAASPGEIYVRDEEGEARLTDHTPSDVMPYQPQRRHFTAPDGTTVEGFVLRDRSGDESGPLLLDIHGGPHDAWGPGFSRHHLYHHHLVAQGWTVLTVNPRGSDGYGEAFWTATHRAWNAADADLLAAVSALVDEGIADPERLAVSGYSYGGYMTCWLTATTRRFQRAVAGASAPDLPTMAASSIEGHYLAAVDPAGDLPAQSPARLVDQVRTPTLLLHAEQDELCPVEGAEGWSAVLRARGIPTQMVRYPDASHLLLFDGRPSQRVDYQNRLVAWITTRLPSSTPA